MRSVDAENLYSSLAETEYESQFVCEPSRNPNVLHDAPPP